MKRQFATAVLALGVVLSPAAFAQNAATPGQAAPMQQQAEPQSSGTPRTDSSGYGTESGGTSNSSIARASGHGVLVSHGGRNDLFAHH
ncbi:hypothetical protein [Paraburkholderia lycopersici]|uniref:Uncharacterized protein n=1 Tax=Paraburkholderia lycopersici TaxID=416944 RepID=A0A1G6Q1M0_9BURK|nr:hypothetical protein [Paraburkholderia lycopersici]SDC85535.1 hypothetical protein SAMN05421548_11131 [Paraburkholderia lycopersici]